MTPNLIGTKLPHLKTSCLTSNIQCLFHGKAKLVVHANSFKSGAGLIDLCYHNKPLTQG